ncbi:hypothetical protein [Acinetobacter sp. ANC 3813]|uniref:hypothetical protein n=1 Tax=Acinetobacter sp. ANC 3813 TaxID=1977873 RepID=UPI000A35980F|nr:hypothetical protein [Acinetobacter sp. ANC 3813]OTG87889.1 hypothetical protein B9T34_16270 [Acinetobacter sp. ANC 3813]
MPNITEILANESGLQYSGVEDASSKTGSYPNIGAITGVFKRGCYNKPMTITKANQRAMLGYDPENPAYAAIADALDAGLPSVQVLRIKGQAGGGALPPFPDMSEDGAADFIQYRGWFGLSWMSDIQWNLEIDGVIYTQTKPIPYPFKDTLDGSIHQILIDHGLEEMFTVTEDSSGGGYMYLNEIGVKRIRFIPLSLTTEYPDKYPYRVEGAEVIEDHVTKVWSFILKKLPEEG